MHRSFVERQAFSPQKKKVHFRGLRCTLGIVAHFQGRRRIFADYGALAGSAQLWHGHRCVAHTIEGSAGHVTLRFQSAAVARLLQSFGRVPYAYDVRIKCTLHSFVL